MPRVTTLLRQSCRAIEDSALLKALQSEIKHELSSDQFQNDGSGSLGDFVLEWDSPKSQDIVLRKKCKSGGEVAVSAILGPENFSSKSSFPRTALMKVCVKKPNLSSFLQFDCGVFSENSLSGFDIHRAYFIPSSNCLDPALYRGPLFSSLDPDLQDGFKQYLMANGISERFTNFILLHLHKKEQNQYVKWLQCLESAMTQDE